MFNFRSAIGPGLVAIFAAVFAIPVEAQDSAQMRLGPTQLEASLLDASELKGGPVGFNSAVPMLRPPLEGRNKGAVIGGLIGAGLGVIMIAAYEFGMERNCGLACSGVRIVGAASVGAIIGGMIGAATEQSDTEREERLPSADMGEEAW